MQAPAITTALAGIRRDEQIDAARARRRSAGEEATSVAAPDVTVRLARAGDEAALVRLAQLDGRGNGMPGIDGPVVVAVVDDELVAARDMAGGAVSDPFRAGPGLVALLEVRARQLSGRSVPAGPAPRAPRQAMPVLRVGGAR
jgi:hypothetical protein